jgi:four helix bundle protein
MTPKELRARTHAFAVAMNAFCQPLLRRTETRDAAEQLLDASSSVGSNHRAAGKARSHAEFAARIGTVDEEADESIYWLEYLRDCRLVSEAELAPHLNEATQLAAIFAASARTARLREEQRRAVKRRPKRSR